MSSISAGTSAGTALVQTGDTSGALVIKTGGSGTTAATFNADQTTTFAGAVSAPSFSGTSSTATNLAGGSAGTIPYQSASGTTQMLAAGTSGYLLQSNGAAAPSWTPAPAPAGTVTAVASGSLSNGSMVIVNSDGTVSTVTQTIDPTPSAGSEVVFNSATSTYTSAVYDAASGKVVIAYQDGGNSNYGTAIVGTVSGTSISFGSEVVFYSGAPNYMAITYDSTAQKVVIAYAPGASGAAIVGTVSGTSISFGTPTTFMSPPGGMGGLSIAYNTAAQKVVIAADAYNSPQQGAAVVGTISGTSISFGSVVTFNSTSSEYPSIAYDSNAQKVVIAYKDGGNSSYGTAIVGTVSGTSISFGSSVVFNSGVTYYTSIAYDSNAQKVVIAYRDAGNSNYGTAVVGTVSGTSISFGSEVVFNSAQTNYTAIAYDTAAQKMAIAYQDVGTNTGNAIVGTVSGTSISFSSEVTFNSANPSYTTIAYDTSAQKMVIAYNDLGNSQYGTACTFVTQVATTNLTTENYIGVSNAAYINGQTATIQTVGSTDDAQSGLTPGQAYYIQKNGSLGLVPDSPSVFAGTALAATKLIIKG